MILGIGFPNPVGWVIDKVSGFVGNVATAGFEVIIGGLTAWVVDAVVWVVGGVFNFFIDSTDPNVQADWFVTGDGPYATTVAETDDQLTARAALADGRLDPPRPRSAATGGDKDDTMLTRRWAASTLCGRVWAEMAAGEGGTFRRWQEVSLAPTCRSCLRIVDAWFPTTEAPAGIGLLACVVAETVEALGSAYITGVPAEHIEAVRRAARKHLRNRGFSSQTNVVNAVVHVSSDDAYQTHRPGAEEGVAR
ncbi:MAG: hypothetical protein ACRD0U_09320 [Acidimicrobiales bacterium]